MGLTDWFRRFLRGDKKEVYMTDRALEDAARRIAAEEFAICTAANLVASLISKCEFRTYKNFAPSRSEEYYLWNVAPNKNQNSSGFLQEIIFRLLTENEILIVEVGGQLIPADTYSVEERAIDENVYSSVSRGSMQFERTFLESQVIHLRYGYADITRMLSRLYDGYADLLTRAQGKYSRAGGRKGTLQIVSNAGGKPDFEEKLNDLLNNRFKNYFTAENAVLPLSNGYEYDEKQIADTGKEYVGDIRALVRDEMDRAAQAYRIPPALLTGEIADVKNAMQNCLTICLDPLADMVSEEICRKRYGRDAYLHGDYLEIDTSCVEHIDVFSVAPNADKLISDGLFGIDELRGMLRHNALNTAWSKQHWMTRNYDRIDRIVEGGEANE